MMHGHTNIKFKEGEILRVEILKGTRGHKSDFRDQFEET